MARQPNTTTSGEPFGEATIEAVWNKSKVAQGYTALRTDVCNAIIGRAAYGRTGIFGWEIDHIKPVAEGGTDDLSNLQPLHWENNRQKGDSWPQWGCKKSG